MGSERLAPIVERGHLPLQRSAGGLAGSAFATDAVKIDHGNLRGRHALRGGRCDSKQSRGERGGMKFFH